MLDLDLIQQNVEKARGVHEWLQRMPVLPALDQGELCADLSDMYTASEYYRQALDALLTTPTSDPDRIAEILADMITELAHIRAHLDSAVPLLQALAESLD